MREVRGERRDEKRGENSLRGEESLASQILETEKDERMSSASNCRARGACKY